MFDMAVKIEGIRDIYSSKMNETPIESHKEEGSTRGKKSRYNNNNNKATESSHLKLPIAEWISKDEFKRRIDANACIRCNSSKHKARKCPKFSRRPKEMYPTDSATHTDKRQRTEIIDKPNAKN